MKNYKELGVFGEKVAKRYLENKGYKIIAQNYKNHYGEVDLIAKNDSFLIFVEVKTRIKNTFGFPEEAINRQKQERLIRISSQYLLENQIENENYRIDSISIEVDEGNNKARIRHLKDAIKYF